MIVRVIWRCDRCANERESTVLLNGYPQPPRGWWLWGQKSICDRHLDTSTVEGT